MSIKISSRIYEENNNDSIGRNKHTYMLVLDAETNHSKLKIVKFLHCSFTLQKTFGPKHKNHLTRSNRK